MDDFDRFLELQLTHMLDRVVSAPPPARGWRKRPPQTITIPVLAVEPLGLELAPEAIPVVEPVVTLPVASVPGI